MDSEIELGVSLGPLRMENPFILASGICDETWESMFRVLKAGAGAVVTKSCGLEPSSGHPNPVIAVLDHGLLNAMGLPNPGIEAMLEEVSQLRSALEDEGMSEKRVIVSVFASNPEGFAELAERVGNKADAIELNLSCPHARGYGMEVGSTREDITRVVKAVKAAAKVPVFAKLTPNTSSISDLAEGAAVGGADGVVAINTLKAMAIDIELRKPILSNIYGGYSGPGIRPVGVRAVYEIHQKLPDMPIIGVGGIDSPSAALEYIMAGATTVEIGSAVQQYGEEIFTALIKGTKEWLAEHGVRDINTLKGAAHYSGV